MKRKSDCPISCSLELFGDKWSLLIIRDALLKGKKNFNEFQSSQEAISTNILTDRLQKMTENGLFVKKKNQKNLLKVDYCLTVKGKELATIILSIAAWGMRYFENTEDVFEALIPKSK